ncbi:MAG: GNAT family N-acetyltransferase [Dehalococcoidales bacterium]|nr:GNAT family N-acetyltransferase [Dehalococcoidales bacterium]
MSDVHIRECTANDIGTICEMEVLWAEEDITWGQVAASPAELGKYLGPYFLVAEENGEITGFGCGSVKTSPGYAVMAEGETYLEVEEIYVTPESRDKGTGGLLLDRLIQAAGENGIQHFMVYSAAKDMESILRFYHGHGFRNWNVRLWR